jgi:hypothetical protein
MAAYMRIADARTCKVHEEIVHAATDRLTTVGSFSKDEVLMATGFLMMVDSIRWDYVKRIIEEDYKTELIPLAARAFRRANQEERKQYPELKTPRQWQTTFPEKFIASGHGKKTYGFAIATKDNAMYVIKLLEIKKGRAEGARKALARTEAIAQREHVLEHIMQLPAPAAT